MSARENSAAHWTAAGSVHSVTCISAPGHEPWPVTKKKRTQWKMTLMGVGAKKERDWMHRTAINQPQKA